MHAFGYQTDDELEAPRALREATLSCRPEEVGRLAAFLAWVEAEVARRGPGSIEPCHFHYRDWDRSASGSDFIIAVS